nr:serine/threonine-protein kinase [Kibdelosporangium sp. MJ126-NF4]CEL13055.1 putative serine/threonine protein kinase [Kibdelosporangium sp. MJ126-NF4]CTQ98742.1 putative serine/threonine protein kinase [Kibdelosporangium sp. MJ126-NF4]
MTNKGDLVAGRYRLIDMVGSGGMGVVWRAHDERLTRTVAVKLVAFDAAVNPRADERVLREARLAARIQHPNAIQVHDVVEHDARPCLVMEYLPSNTLAAVLADRGTLPADEVARIGAQIASALAVAHAAGILHRDVKPDNVLIAPDGTVKITDFGISRLVGDATRTEVGLIVGTPAYLAPEVASGHRAEYASDVFSLGATLYAASEGEPPFGNDDNSIAVLRRAASGEITPPRRSGTLGPLLLWLLRANPGDRPSMVEAQEYLATGKQPPRSRPRVTTVAIQARKPPRRRTLVTAIAILVVTLGLVAGLRINPHRATQATPEIVVPTPDRWPSTCQADYKITKSWQNRYEALVVIRNPTDTPLNDWAATWTLPTGHNIAHLWNGRLSADNKAVRVTPGPINATVNSSTSFGFVAAASGSARVKPNVLCTGYW